MQQLEGAENGKDVRKFVRRKSSMLLHLKFKKKKKSKFFHHTIEMTNDKQNSSAREGLTMFQWPIDAE